MAVLFVEMAVSNSYHGGISNKKETLMSTNNSSLLRNALYGNSIFCSTSGLAFAVFSGPIADFLGLSASWIILVLGIGLLLYGLEVFWFARKDSINQGFAKFVISADIVWVLGSLSLIFTNLVAFTSPGKWAIAIIADIVLVFAIAQYIGLRRMIN
jgi:hypothetical protein